MNEEKVASDDDKIVVNLLNKSRWNFSKEADIHDDAQKKKNTAASRLSCAVRCRRRRRGQNLLKIP